MKAGTYLVYIFFFLILTFTGLAQDKTSYFLGLNPQNNALNPAYTYNRSIVIFNPALSISVANSGLTFHTMFNKGKGAQDTLLFWDFEKMEKKLGKSNSFYGEGGISLFFAGKPLRHRMYLSFQLSRKYTAVLSYPQTFLELRYGNADLQQNKPRTIDLNHYALNGSAYDEFSFGLSKQFSKKFTGGAHLKILQGKFGVRTDRFLASIVTSPDFSSSVLSTNARVLFSSPVLKRKPGSSRLEIDMSGMREQSSWLYYTLGNLGAAIDLGAIWNVSDRLKLAASLNDLGFIHWGAEPQQLVSKGEYLFDGFYFSAQNFEKFDAKNYFKHYTDTIQTLFFPKENYESFSTRLNAKSYLGASYKYDDHYTFTGLIKSTFYKEYFLLETTLGAVYRPKKRIAVSGTWSFSNYSLYNFGLGASYTGKKYQVYAVTDNINAITILDVKGVNLALGVSWVIWQE